MEQIKETMVKRRYILEVMQQGYLVYSVIAMTEEEAVERFYKGEAKQVRSALKPMEGEKPNVYR